MTIRIFDVQRAANGNRIFDIQAVPAAPPVIVPVPDPEFEAWLKDPHAIRIVLVEADVLTDGVETTRYMAMGGYTTGPGDTPANLHYQPIISAGIQFTEQLSLSSAASLSTGDIEINNANGVRESWFGDIWTNRRVRAWIGDPRWSRASFRPIFDGISAGIARKGATTLALKLRDKLQRLNTPMTESKLGDDSPNKDAIIPICLGEGHNITPLAIDPSILKYQVHNGPVKSIEEVRANGLPVSANIDNAVGTFTLNAAPVGAITCSVEGDQFGGVYRNTVGALVQRIVTGYGKASDRYTADDLDLGNLAAFDAAHTAPVGLYIADRTNVLIACQMLAGSLGAQIIPSRLGKLRIIQIALSASSTFDIRPEHVVADTLLPATTIDPVAAVKLGFCKDWTVQTGLQTSIPEQHKDLFATEWLTTTMSDAAVKAAYKLDEDPIQQDTMLLRRIDADAEAARRLNLWKVQRTMYEFEGTPEMLQLELGQAVTIYNRRYGMAGGLPALVMMLEPDWVNGHCKVGVLV